MKPKPRETPRRKRGLPDSYNYSFHLYVNENAGKVDDIRRRAQHNTESKATSIFVGRHNQQFEEQKEMETQGAQISAE